MATTKPKSQSSGPIVSGQVMVKSAQEVELLKQVFFPSIFSLSTLIQ